MSARRKGGKQRVRHPRPLHHEMTVFVYSPKNQGILRLVGEQASLAQYAESHPEVVGFRTPGPTVQVTIAGVPEKITLGMTVSYADGVEGALAYADQNDIARGLPEALEQCAKDLPMRIIVLDAETFRRDAYFYAGWEQLVRYIHPQVDFERLPATGQIRKLLEKPHRLSVDDVSHKVHAEPADVLAAVAYLAYRGEVKIDMRNGRYDLLSTVGIPR